MVPMFDPRQQHQQQQFAMMQQASGGIIAEDLRSLRSMTNSVPEQDMDMDTDMMDHSFLQQPNFSGAYEAQGITTSASDGSCLAPTDPMNHHLTFGFDTAYP